METKAIAFAGEYSLTRDKAGTLEKVRRETGADLTAVITGGAFRADGTPHLLGSAGQQDAALDAGADIVLRLPVIATLSGFDTQAFATMSLCDRVGAFENLMVPVHGIQLPLLEELAMFLFKEPMPYQKRVRQLLEEGLSPAKARAKGAEAFVPGVEQVLLDPLDSYAVELRLAALRRYSRVKIAPFEVRTCEIGEISGTEALSCGAVENGAYEEEGKAPWDRLLAEELARYLSEKDTRTLREQAQMTPSCPWQITENLVRCRDELLRCCSFMEMAETLSTVKVSPEQVRRGLLMLLLGIRLPNLSIAGLEAFCPYVRVDGMKSSSSGEWESVLRKAEARVIARDGLVLSPVPPDESRMRLAAFDTAADALWNKIMSGRTAE